MMMRNKNTPKEIRARKEADSIGKKIQPKILIQKVNHLLSTNYDF